MAVEVLVARGDITQAKDDAIVVSLFEGVDRPGGATKAVDDATGGAITRAIRAGDLKGKIGDTLLFHPTGVSAPRVLVVGLGKRKGFDADSVRRAAGRAARALDGKVAGFTTVCHGAGAGGLKPEAAAQALVEGTLLALWKWDKHKATPKEDPPKVCKRVTIVETDGRQIPALRKGVHAGLVLSESTNLARDLASESGDDAAPAALAERIRKMARELRLRCEVWDKAKVQAKGFGGLLAVNQGSVREPRVVVLEHNPNGRDTVVVVGKGICFDSGGISIKPGEGMDLMKFDKSGAAATAAILRACAILNVRNRVVGLMPFTDNLPSGSAYKPGDIVKAYGGKTIEVLNTDAEGRMILADALAYAGEFKPKVIVDLATLTGACVVALGNHASGLMSTDRRLAAGIRRAGEVTHERVAELPFYEDYDKQIESLVADVKQVGGRSAGAITAGRMLSKFAPEGVPWAHLDIAGTAWNEKPSDYNGDYLGLGATGAGVRLVTQLLLDWKRR